MMTKLSARHLATFTEDKGASGYERRDKTKSR